MPQQKKDNDSFPEKVRLRQHALKRLGSVPVVLEVYGGWGRLNTACYASVPTGLLFEKDSRKSEILSQLRPEWGVYEGDSVGMLAAGVGSEWPCSFVDLDPYGEPWPALAALFGSDRPWPARLALAVHDGLRNTLMLGKAWSVESMRPLVEHYGNAYISEHYLACAKELCASLAAPQGYQVAEWWGFYGGYHQQSTHYACVLER